MLTRAPTSQVPEPHQRDRRCAETDRHSLQETTAAADSESGPRHAAGPCKDRLSQPCVYAGGDLAVEFLQERCHYRIAVLRAKFVVNLSSSADLVRGQRRAFHTERLRHETRQSAAPIAGR